MIAVYCTVTSNQSPEIAQENRERVQNSRGLASDSKCLSHEYKQIFLLPGPVQSGPAALPGFLKMGRSIGHLAWGQRGRDMVLTTHIHLAMRFRLGGVIPLRPFCAFMAFYRP